MILLNEFIKLNVTKEFMEMFLVVIQFGAILAVIVLYFKKLNPFKKDPKERNNTIALWIKVLIACIPAAIIGLLFDDVLDKYFYNPLTVSITLIVYGILFIVVENYRKGKKTTVNTLKQITPKLALYVGLFQLLALIPGTSRSGATILGGLLLGMDRSIITEYTFFLAIPVMFGASLLKLVKFGFAFTSTQLIILFVGLLTAFIVSLFSINFLLKYIKKNDFKIFGWYRIILGLIIILYFIIF